MKHPRVLFFSAVASALVCSFNVNAQNQSVDDTVKSDIKAPIYLSVDHSLLEELISKKKFSLSDVHKPFLEDVNRIFENHLEGLRDRNFNLTASVLEDLNKQGVLTDQETLKYMIDLVLQIHTFGHEKYPAMKNRKASDYFEYLQEEINKQDRFKTTLTDFTFKATTKAVDDGLITMDEAYASLTDLVNRIQNPDFQAMREEEEGLNADTNMSVEQETPGAEGENKVLR